MTHFKKISLMLITTLLLGACIEDSSDDDDVDNDAQEEEGMGYFIDSPVQGLAYSSASHSGTTDEFGRFEYEEGETVTFKLGSLTLGSAATAKAIHVSDLFDDADANDRDTINLARLLLTLDSNADSDDGIQLSAQAISAANDTQFPNGLDFTSASFAADVANYIATSGVTNDTVTELVSAQDAQEHMTNTLAEVEGLIAGYGNECVPRAAFNEYVNNVTPKHDVSGISPDLSSIAITMTNDYAGDIDKLKIEIFGLPNSASYTNCRIDWSGFMCDGFTSNSIFELHDSGILQILNEDTGLPDTEIEYDVDVANKTLTVNLIESLKANYVYSAHVYNDGDNGFEDDYKTWWQFTTGSN